MMYVLNGIHPVEGDIQSLFIRGERQLAIDVAKAWFKRGWEPVLYSKTYGGNFVFLFDYRHHRLPKSTKRQLRKAA